MDRTLEFHSIASIFLQDGATAGGVVREIGRPKTGSSQFILGAVTLFEHLKHNDDLVQDMNRLATRKEFSNDPTKSMQELSGIFQSRVAWIQTTIKALKADSEVGQEGSHLQQHNKLIVQWLTKSIGSQISAFKNALKEHGKHVAERNQRVMQYGGEAADSASSSSRAPLMEGSGKYAMFSKAALEASPLVEKQNAAMRRPPSSVSRADGGEGDGALPTGLHQRSAPQWRSAGPNASSQSTTGPASGVGQRARYPNPSQAYAQPSSGLQSGQVAQQQTHSHKSDFRLRAAEKVETTVRQMGELFAQMASLVAEQSETITRIEDDVEAGLMNTKDAHESIQKVYDITKGNRSMIIKIFLLLLFFICLFLWWT